MPNKNKQAISVREAAQHLGCSDDTIHAGILSGQLPFGVALKMPSGRYKYIIPRAAFEKWCENPKGFVQGCSI